MKFRYGLIGILILFVSLYSQGQESEEEILQYITSLGTAEQKDPMEIIELLDPIISQSKRLGTQKVYLEAATKKTENLIEIEQIPAAQTLLSELLPLAQKIDDPIILVRLAICELNVLERQGYSQKLDNKYRSLMNKATLIEDDKTLGKIYLAAGRVKSRLTDYSEALNSLHKAYRIAEKLKDEQLLDQVSGELGTANIRLENFEEGIAYYLKSLEISLNKNAKYDQSVIFYNLGKAYLSNNNFEKSQEMFDNSILINLELNDDIGLMWSKRGLADLALKQQQWKKAIELYNEASAFFSQIDDKMSEFRSLNGQAEAYIAIKDVANAQRSLTSSKQLLNSFPTSENTLSYQQILAKLKFLEGNYKAAFELAINNIEIIKNAHKLSKKKEVERQRVQFDSDMKDTENRILIENNELQKFKIAQQQKQQYLWYLIIALGSLTLIFVTLMLYKQIQLRDSYKTMALRDHLTRSPNRRAIIEYAKACYTESVLNGNSLIIGLVDLDNFKQFNDTYGHDVGDNVLIAFAKACKNSMRDDCNFGRYGGEEWLIVLPNTSETLAREIFSRIKQNFSSIKINGLPQKHNVTFTVGAEEFDKDTHKNVDNMISQADKKLYLAKAQGKDSVLI